MHDEKSGEQVWQVVNNRSSKFTAVVALEDMWSIKQAENVDQLLCYGYCCLVLEGPQHYELGQVILVHKQPLELAVRNALHVMRSTWPRLLKSLDVIGLTTIPALLRGC